MKVVVCGLCVLALYGCMPAHAKVWQPSAGHAQTPLWPGTPPDGQPMPGPEIVTMGQHSKAGKPADRESARPDFALAIYPGHLATDRDLASDNDTLNRNVPVSRATPPTFLVQAEDDYVDGAKQSLVYYIALAKAHVPSELHIYARGGHGFGLRPTSLPITHWPELAEAWLHRIGIIAN